MKKALFLLFMATLLALPVKPATALQCVTYARQVSGLNLKGDAWQWWNAAAGVYQRDRLPKKGGVLVFSRQGSMRHGHVSVVSKVVSNRLVLVDHANWAPVRTEGRGEVSEAVPVLDVSARNDWSQVRVWYRPANDYGNRVYKTEGFVYDPSQPIETKAPRSAALERVALKKSLPAEAKPAVAPAIQAVAVPDAQAVAAPAAPAEPARHAPLIEAAAPAAIAPAAIAPVAAASVSGDLVTVARHVFRPRRPEGQTLGALPNEFVFN